MRQISCFILFFMITCSSLCTSLAAVLTSSFFFLNDTATTEISPLPLHDALPIYDGDLPGAAEIRPRARHRRHEQRPEPEHPGAESGGGWDGRVIRQREFPPDEPPVPTTTAFRSEEHTSELQSLRHLVCRLLLEKK